MTFMRSEAVSGRSAATGRMLATNRYASWTRECRSSSRTRSREQTAWCAGESTIEREVDNARWRIVHDELVSISVRRGALDADEARCLREAETLKIWKPFGMVSMIDYLERAAGYAPRTAQERMRVARALGDLPELTHAFASGELTFSAVKELSRVATRATEAAWRAAARDKNLREIEDLVAGRKPGDRPEDPAEPEARLHGMKFDDVTGDVVALVRRARQLLDTEHGTRMSDSEILGALAMSVIDGRSGAAAGASDDAHVGVSDHHGRARSQLSYGECTVCKRAWQVGAGVRIPVTAEVLDRVKCDAQILGSLDGDGPERATQTIPPAVERFIHERDGHVCQTPGCRSSRGLEIHHIIHRKNGGTHAPWNLSLRCFACHQAHHDGKLAITGTAPDHIITARREDVHATRAALVAAAPITTSPEGKATRKLDAVVRRTEAIAAMRTMGWKPATASGMVDAAIAALAPGASLEAVILEALRRCPRPASS